MKKRIFYTEVFYVIGLILLAFGIAFMEKADFGLSMIAAPEYLLHLKISQTLPFFSFGMAGYTVQALVLIVMMLIMRKFKIAYLFSFLTAVIYGFMLDGAMLALRGIPAELFWVRLIFYALGLILAAAGIALLFRTYFAPGVYELFVKEMSLHFGKDMFRFKTIYDISSCVVAVILSFAFFGLWQFEGIKLGTVVCALLNGKLIGICSKIFDRFWDFKDGLKWRPFFE